MKGVLHPYGDDREYNMNEFMENMEKLQKLLSEAKERVAGFILVYLVMAVGILAIVALAGVISLVTGWNILFSAFAVLVSIPVALVINHCREE